MPVAMIYLWVITLFSAIANRSAITIMTGFQNSVIRTQVVLNRLDLILLLFQK
jgi:hypothetical protein